MERKDPSVCTHNQFHVRSGVVKMSADPGQDKPAEMVAYIQIRCEECWTRFSINQVDVRDDEIRAVISPGKPESEDETNATKKDIGTDRPPPGLGPTLGLV